MARMPGVRLRSTALLIALTLAVVAAPAAANNYASAKNGRIALFDGGAYTIGPGGGGLANVPVPDPEGDGWGSAQPVISPTGQQLAAGNWIDGGCYEIIQPDETMFHTCWAAYDTYLISVRGGAGRQLGSGIPVAFSPDGKGVVLAYRGDLSLVRADGKWTKGLGPGTDADISPDGGGVAVSEGDGRGISLMPVSGQERVTLTDPPAGYSDDSPSYSPDGTRLVFVRRHNQSNAGQALAVRLDGTGLVALTGVPSVGDVDYSPDGRSIVFSDGSEHGLYRVHSEGGTPWQITSVGFPGGPVSWAPAFRCAGRIATIIGDDGPDRLIGTRRADVIVGNAGPDRIDGRGGNDRICGGDGRDSLKGSEGDDKLVGGPGRDRSRQ